MSTYPKPYLMASQYFGVGVPMQIYVHITPLKTKGSSGIMVAHPQSTKVEQHTRWNSKVTTFSIVMHTSPKPLSDIFDHFYTLPRLSSQLGTLNHCYPLTSQYCGHSKCHTYAISHIPRPFLLCLPIKLQALAYIILALALVTYIVIIGFD